MTAFVSRRYRSPFIAQLPLTRNRISLPLQLAYDIREIALLLLVLLKRNDNHPTCICIIFAGHLDRHPVSPRTNSSFNYRHTDLPRDVRIIPKKLYSRGETFLPRPAWSSGRAPATTAAPAAAADQPAHDQESDDSHGSPDDDVRHSAPRFLFFASPFGAFLGPATRPAPQPLPTSHKISSVAHFGYSSFETSKPQSDAILTRASRCSAETVAVRERIQSDERSPPVTSARSYFGESQMIR